MKNLIEQIDNGHGADASSEITKTLNQKLKKAIQESRVSTMAEIYDHGDDDAHDERVQHSHPVWQAAARARSLTHACPSCGGKNKLTAKGAAMGHQCGLCKDKAEGRTGGGYY